MGLTPRQHLFVHYYLTEANRNATEAAYLAGYGGARDSAKVAGSRLLGNGAVQEAIAQGRRLLANAAVQEAIAAATAELAMERAEILARLSAIARGSLQDFLVIAEDGAWRIDLHQARQRGVMPLVKKLKQGKHGLEIQLHSAPEALVILARVHQMFLDRQTAVEVRILNVVLDALPEEFRAAVCEALRAEFEIAGDIGGAWLASGDGADDPLGSFDPNEGSGA